MRLRIGDVYVAEHEHELDLERWDQVHLRLEPLDAGPIEPGRRLVTIPRGARIEIELEKIRA